MCCRQCHVEGWVSGVTRKIFRGVGSGVQQIQLKTDRTGSGGGSPLVSGSEGNCNLVQEIPFHKVKCFGTLRLFLIQPIYLSLLI
jgi:hypothetical protein